MEIESNIVMQYGELIEFVVSCLRLEEIPLQTNMSMPDKTFYQTNH